VWADPYGAGYQQTRTLAAAASGGLFGHGAGQGWLKNIVAANTDMVFGVICEEFGLLIAVSAVLSILILALFAFRSAAHGRSTYYVIAACAAASLMVAQLSLNVFGSLDILPFTGVTFPFVSKGGTSLLSCWMLLAFIKAADTRKNASFVVKSADSQFKRNKNRGAEA
ncbi:MAG: FtsW/RodA/SpoVE family cell cycle protein, partial [Oscillospiraceae bacterium]|nr:FtsW/RodA/SpoVE family cell cycle protein [Oscillospiraceae bacterium]